MIRIRAMTKSDVPFGMRLKEQAGWNQLENDWIRFLTMEPDGCFVGELDGRPVGTTTTCIFGAVAWIAMVLVDSATRKRGVGTALMEHALAFLDQRGVRTIRLDATPLGQRIYEKLGFVSEYTLARYAGVPTPGPMVARQFVQLTEPDHLQRLYDLDQTVTATDRRKLLRSLFDEGIREARVVERFGEIDGYLMARPGARAWQIGPCIANATAGPLLLADARQRHAGKSVYLDIPRDNQAACAAAQSMGLAEQRHLTRMYRGVRIDERRDQLWCSSGPEKG